MDLNNIQLPGSLVAAVYKNNLVESNQLPLPKKSAEPGKGPAGIQFLGKNQKGVCLLVRYSNDVHLPDKQLNFFTSILQACKLDLGDVAIINCQRQEFSFAMLQEQIKCNYLLFFGVGPSTIGLEPVVDFTITQYKDCQLLHSPAAEDLNSTSAESKSLKGKLWGCLKQLFAV